MILLIDNRDSFTWNLAAELEALGATVRVSPASTLAAGEVLALRPAGIVLGPGPGTPERAGCSEDLVRLLANGPRPGPPFLGVCLGHQALATALGGRLMPARELVHGQTRPVHHDGRGLFHELPSPLELTRYNSLVVDPSSLPPELETCATDGAEEIQALRHRSRPLEGIQAHPEAALSLDQGGRALLARFLEACQDAPLRS